MIQWPRRKSEHGFRASQWITHKWALDAVEDEDLNDHDDGHDSVEVDNVESREPTFAEEFADYIEVSNVVVLRV